MSKRIALTILIALALALTACQRTASTPVPTPDFPSPATASGNMQVVELAGTQTAIATSGTPVVILQPSATPEANQTTQPQVVTPEVTQSSAATTPMPLPSVTTIPGSPTLPTTYTLQKGEFPFCIARRFNIDPDELLALNGLSRSQSYFTPGTVLKIPQTGKAFPGARALLTHPTQYTVLSGDTIYSIACKFGDVDPLTIANQNGLQPPYTLTTGAQITIP